MRPPVDLTLYLVTDTAQCGGPDGVVATVGAAVRGGVTCVQLRDPHASDTELVTLGRRLVTTLTPTGTPLIVNDRPDLVAEIGAQGAHIGQGDIDVCEARQLLGPDRVLGLSVQTVAHVEAVHDLDATIDHLGVGPVWATASKPDHATPGGIVGATEVVAASPWACVLIGGITAERAPSLRSTGADGIAVISAVCGTPDPEASAQILREAWLSPGVPGADPAG